MSTSRILNGTLGRTTTQILFLPGQSHSQFLPPPGQSQTLLATEISSSPCAVPGTTLPRSGVSDMAGLSIRALLTLCVWTLLGLASVAVVGSAAPTDSEVQSSHTSSPEFLSELRRAVLEQQSLLLTLQSSVLALQSLVARHVTASPPSCPQATPSTTNAPDTSTMPSSTSSTTTPSSAYSTTNPPSSSGSGGATYIRWGRTSCPGDSELVYKGYAGGNSYANTGSAVDYLCLPEHPQYANYTDAVDSVSGYVYGAEYQTGSRLPNFHNHDHDVPCAVCRSPSRTTALMIPARTSCYPGFHLEYLGYLMGGRSDHAAASQYVCVDHQPENVVGGEADQNGKLFYFVESRCGPLPCPPYVNGRELPCVVCSK